MTTEQISKWLDPSCRDGYLIPYEFELASKHAKKIIRVYIEEALFKFYLNINCSLEKKIMVVPEDFIKLSVKLYKFSEYAREVIETTNKYIKKSIYVIHNIEFKIPMPVSDFILLNKIGSFDLIHFDIDIDTFIKFPNIFSFDSPISKDYSIPNMKYLIDHQDLVSCITITNDLKKTAIPYTFTSSNKLTSQDLIHYYDIIQEINTDNYNDAKIIYRDHLTAHGKEFIERFLFSDTLEPCRELLKKLEQKGIGL